MTNTSAGTIRYPVPFSHPDWELPEVPVPESPAQREYADRLKEMLDAWLARSGRPGAIVRNLRIRWDEANPRVGLDPNVCFVDTLPPGFLEGEIEDLRLWLPGHRVPPLAIEIVDVSHPYKDYRRIQDKYAAVGAQELWVYDPAKYGPKAMAGPTLLQVWERSSSDVLIRQYYGDEPARSNYLGAWLLPRQRDHLLISDDREGSRPWSTRAE